MVIAITVIVNKIIIVSPDWVVTDMGEVDKSTSVKWETESASWPVGCV